jgi:hypothetical protein
MLSIYYISPSSSDFNTIPVNINILFHTETIMQFSTLIIIRGATAPTNLVRLSSRRWQSFPTAPDGPGLTCGQHIESHSCIFSFLNRTVTSLFK